MQKYLIYDGHCSDCRRLAQSFKKSADSKLDILSIHDSKAKELLDHAYPKGWMHAPYLVLADQSAVHAWTGASMALRLAWLIGPRQAWFIWKAARRSRIHLLRGSAQPITTKIGRRRFLKTGIGTGLAIVLSLVRNSPLFKIREVQANNC